MTHLSIGTPAPTFNLTAADGKTHTLADYTGQWLVLYFYPKAMTPGCTTQACDIRSNMEILTQKKIRILGISPDAPERLQRFIDKEQLNFPLLSDSDHKASEAYGAWGEKKLYGKSFMGIHRMTFIINPKGQIAAIMPKVKAKKHFEDLLDTINNLI